MEDHHQYYCVLCKQNHDDKKYPIIMIVQGHGYACGAPAIKDEMDMGFSNIQGWAF